MTQTIETLVLPVVPLRRLVVYPHMTLFFDAGRERSIASLDEAMMNGAQVILTTQISDDADDPNLEDVHPIGVLAHVRQMLRLQNDSVRVLVEGLTRVRIEEFYRQEDYWQCKTTALSTEPEDAMLSEAARRSALQALNDYARGTDKLPPSLAQSIADIEDPSRVGDMIAANVPLSTREKLRILSLIDPVERLSEIIVLLKREISLNEVSGAILSKVRQGMEKQQREHFLREQMRVIQRELGEGGDSGEETQALRDRAETVKLNEEAKQKVTKELDRLGRMHPSSPEANVSRTYVETILDLPWENYSAQEFDVKKAQAILDEDHFGLEKIKQRVIEYLAVHSLTGSMKGPILCFVGPPGVGKTSIARSIARALGRSYERMSLGGVHDEAEIRGHRRTYIGAIPGRIITSIKQAGTANPVIVFDEIDKLGADYRGDPSSALLEVLDAEQNYAFRDHYLDVPFDLSKVLFLTTANSLDTIPRALLDRMEVIELSGYIPDEKIQIAKRFLLPKQLKENGLDDSFLTISSDGITQLIENYTREAGVRTLERRIGALCRKGAIAKSEGKKKFHISAGMLEKLLDIPPYRHQQTLEQSAVGQVNGLAWTPMGGEILTIEATPMPGSGKLILTGQLGDVMQESAQAAVSFIRTHAEMLKIDPSFYNTRDLHIHVPEGATPKDGPSAGVSMATAVVSALTGIPVKQDVAMTGEITLRGRVLPIGGLKEKVLAAHRAGVRRIFFPEENKSSLKDIPQKVLKQVDMVPVKQVDEIFTGALDR